MVLTAKCLNETTKWVDKILKTIKAVEPYPPVVQFIMLYKVVRAYGSIGEILKCDHSMKAIEQYFPVVQFVMLYKVAILEQYFPKMLNFDDVCSFFSILGSILKVSY